MCHAVDFLKGLKENDRKTIDKLKTTIFPMLISWMQDRQGVLEDTEDIFNDAILIVLNKIRNNSLTLCCEFPTFFIAICKNLWRQKLRKKSQMPIANNIVIEELSDTPYDSTKDIKHQIYLSVFDKLDPGCKELIKLKTENRSNAEIAKIMGFKNAQAVADKKKSCMKKIAKEIAKSKEYKEFKDEL